MKIWGRTALCMVLAAALSGCSLFCSPYQTVSIQANPKNATIMVNGQAYKSPANVSVVRNNGLSIAVRCNGYSSESEQVGTRFSTCGILDIVGGVFFLIPLVGLVSPGAYCLTQDHFSFDLQPLNGNAQ